MYTNGLSPSILERPEVHVSGRQLPFHAGWLYTVSVDGSVKDEINSLVRWTKEQIIDVQGYYTESLTGYVFGGQQMEGWARPEPPQPMPKRKRRRIRYDEWRRM